MNPEYKPSLTVSIHYVPDIHEKIKPIVEKIEAMANETEVTVKVVPQFNTKPSTQYNRHALHKYFASPTESVILSTLFVDSDFRKLDDAEWIEAIAAQENALKAFHAFLKQYVETLK
jgi:hypothetical protein